jgi:hypothetical protein
MFAYARDRQRRSSVVGAAEAEPLAPVARLVQFVELGLDRLAGLVAGVCVVELDLPPAPASLKALPLADRRRPSISASVSSPTFSPSMVTVAIPG